MGHDSKQTQVLRNVRPIRSRTKGNAGLVDLDIEGLPALIDSIVEAKLSVKHSL